MKLTTLIAPLVTMMLAVTSQADGQVGSRGTYLIYQDGTKIGSEDYAWNDNVLEAHCVLDSSGVPVELSPRLTVDVTTLMPVAYELNENRGETQGQVSLAFTPNKVEFSRTKNGTKSTKLLKIKPADLVIDNESCSLFLLVVDRYDFQAGGEQDFTVFDPQSRRAYVAHAKFRGLGTIDIHGGTARTRRLTLILEDVAVDLYVDAAGAVPQISIPLRKVEARLNGYTGCASAETAGLVQLAVKRSN